MTFALKVARHEYERTAPVSKTPLAIKAAAALEVREKEREKEKQKEKERDAGVVSRDTEKVAAAPLKRPPLTAYQRWSRDPKVTIYRSLFISHYL